MGLDRKLSDWRDAGLIDAATAEAIRAYEEREAKPVARWAAIAIGLLALALGLTLVVAANWDAIPPAVKLAVHGLLTIAAAATVWQARGLWLREGALFLLGALVLAGIALQGQIYQITSPLWTAFGWWALLMTPALLVAGATRLTAFGWAAMLAITALAYAGDMPTPDLAADNLPAALPAVLLLATLLLPGLAEPFRSGLREAGLTLLLGGASLAQFGWAVTISPPDAREAALRLLLALLLAGVAFMRAGREAAGPRRVLRAVLATTSVAVLLAIAIPHGDSFVPRAVGALLFLGLWGLVAKAAHEAGWRVLFNIAVAAIALRLFIIYFELFESQAATGAGLIAGGALLVGLTLAWSRIVRRWRPA